MGIPPTACRGDPLARPGRRVAHRPHGDRRARYGRSVNTVPAAVRHAVHPPPENTGPASGGGILADGADSARADPTTIGRVRSRQISGTTWGVAPPPGVRRE